MNHFANNIQFLNASTMPNYNNNNQFNISLGPPNNAIESIKNEFKNIYQNPMSNLGISVG